ncbi:MAG: hypothetical protein O2783_05315 [Chloroflexi bacterium]|nr:hypothetical protein [Chloroflexota bacterium]
MGLAHVAGLLIAFAFTPLYGLALVIEWLASACLQIFTVTSQSTLHTLVPNEYRGRVMGIWGMTHSLMQPMGGLAMGGAASVIATSTVVAIGGSVVALFGLLGTGLNSRIRNIGDESTATTPSEAAK